MTAICIVSANAGRARIFLQARSTDALQEINVMVSPTARQREGEIVTDDLGQRSASKSRHNTGQPTQPSGYQPHQSPSQHETQLFARDVAHFLTEAHNEGRFARLCLVASPEFLGVLRQEVDPSLKSAVSLEIDKDYTHDTPAVLLDRLKRQGLKN